MANNTKNINATVITKIINFASNPTKWCTYEMYVDLLKKESNSVEPISRPVFNLILNAYEGHTNKLTKLDTITIANLCK